MSKNRRQSAKRIKDPEGGFLCSCGCGRKPQPPRRTWYSQACVHEWKVKNDPQYVRLQLLERDKGVCAACGTDVEALRFRLRRLSRIARGWSTIRNPGMCGKVRREKMEWLARWCRDRGYPSPMENRSWWDADHILEVVKGGGQCGMDNYQTLCIPCHKAKTAKLARERALERRRHKDSPQQVLKL